MSVEEALAAYETARHRLPDVTKGRTVPKRIATILDLTRDFDAFFLDAFGVLNVGEDAIPGVPEQIAELQRKGKRLIVVSNAAGIPHADLMRKYRSLGYDFDPDDVVTSRKTMARAVGLEPKQTWGLMLGQGVPPGAFGDLDHVVLKDNQADFDRVDAFLLIGSPTWQENQQSLLEISLSHRARPVFVGNPDIVAPRTNGFSIEPGFYAHRLADRTGIVPRFFGKPFANIYDIAFQRLDPDTPKQRVVMVGDSLHTDILGAQVAGVASVLALDHGFLTGRDAEADMDATGIWPDYVMTHT